MTSTEEEPGGGGGWRFQAFASFQEKGYPWLWAANVSYGLVQSSVLFAFVWLALERLEDAGASFLALVTLMAVIPVLLVGLPAGVLADHKDRRLVLVASHVLVALALVLAAILSGTQAVSQGLVLVLALLMGIGVAVGAPVRTALIPAVVPKSRLLNANALYVFAQGIGALLGPGIAGAAIALGGVGSAFAVLAAVILAGALFLIPLHVPPRDPPPWPQEARGFRQQLRLSGMFADIAAGFRFITSGAAEVRTLFLLLLTVSLLGPWLALDAGVLVNQLDTTAFGASLLFGVMGLGGLVTLFILASITRLSNAGGLYAVMLVVGAALTAAIWFSSSYVLVALLMFVYGLALEGRGILFRTLVQSQTPTSLMGRVMATYFVVLAAGTALGAMVTVVARNVLRGDAWIVLAVVVTVAVVAFVLVRQPGLRRMPSHPEEPEAVTAESGSGWRRSDPLG